MSETTGLEVAVIGLAGRFPQAPDAEALWRNLQGGVDGLSRFDADELRAAGVPERLLSDSRYVRVGGVLDQAEWFDAAFFGLSAREAELTDPQQRVFLECAWEALEDAGYDPQGLRAPAGVYAGVSRSTYLQHLLSHPELVETVGGFQVALGNDKDFLAPRVSYKLGLRGPSVVVQTACSTSLVAVHLACQALLAGECGVALAGGVSILFPQVSGYVSTEGGIFAPDGVCRPFDARARGTLAGRGAGVVVLKRLEDALRDHDRVRAVIKGSAVNNDGNLKVGFTAPGLEGQVAVVRAALGAAEVEPESIGYVEAHGTGTELGDPLEVAALNRAFGLAGGVRTCALGAIKGSIGHLDAAAGVAGLIKTVLMLEHAQLPPNPHFERANPQIDFDAGPFYVNAELRAWPARTGAPRRAGVSSFGMGGTNAHVVLQEAAPQEPLSRGRPWHVLLLSARTPFALEQVTDRLAAHLAAHPELPLADAAFTSQAGRTTFARRRALLCRRVDDARQALATRSPELLGAHAQQAEREVFFLFPGQGTQHARMAQALYRDEPGFRAAFDACADGLQPRLGVDLRHLLVTPAHDEAQIEAQLRQTGLAQPALFAVQYALAALLAEWGVRPRAMLGHGLGEYVAACLAGVLSLDDALALVAERGRLMQALPPGAMLLVRLGEDDVCARLSPELSLAAVHAPELCVASGPLAAIEAWQAELHASGVQATRLHTSHAFHSAMMEPLRAPFAEALRRVTLHAPRLRYVSNVSGTWITPEEAKDAEYWLRHLRAPVRFADGLLTLFAEGDGVLLEVGPGATLTQLARQHPARPAELAAVTCLPGPKEAGHDGATLAGAVARLWLQGVALDWAGYHRHAPRRRVALPTYPFERRRYFVELRRAVPLAASGGPPPSDAPDALSGAAPPSPAAGPGTLHPRPELPVAYVAPRDAREERLTQLYGELLGVSPVGIHDNFFELGGHSLLATQLAEAVRASEGLELALRALFDAPTVAGLAEALGAQEAAGSETPRTPAGLTQIVPDPLRRHEPFPLTDVQQAYWIGRSGALELGQVATHTYLEADSDDLDLPRFERAWQLLIARHDMLRAVFLPDGLQRVLPEVPLFRIRVEDLSALTPEAREHALLERRHALSHRVLPADTWPLFDVQATRLDTRSLRLHVSFDLLIGDAWSFGLMLSELAQFYRRPELRAETLELTFRDYVLAEQALQQTPLYARALDYWRGRLRDLPPAPDLPLRRSLPSLDAPRFTRRAGALSAEAWKKLRARAIRAGLTPSGVLLTAFSEVLAVWSRAPRFTLNLTLFNRLPLHPQVGGLVGDFTSLTLLAIDAAQPGTFEERARRVQGQLFDDLDQRYVSAVRVLRELQREQGARVLMPVVFTSTLALDARRSETPAGSAFALGRPVFSISQTPQVLIDHQVGMQAGQLVFNWDAVDEAFPAGLLDALFAAYCGLVERLAEDEATWQATRLDLVPREQLELRAALNATQTPLPAGLLHEPFGRRARAAPDEPALITGSARLSYADLERRADALAARLQRAGLSPGTLVAVELEKSPAQIAAVLGVLRAGGAYLPLDPSLPRARRWQLLEHGRVAWVVRGDAAETDLPSGVRALSALADAPGEPRAPGATSQRPHDLAYVIFTSGSTGQPKGVMIEHAAALNTVVDVNRRFGLGQRDRVLGLSALSFDLSVWDLFGVLAAGAALVLPDADKLRDPAHWAELMRRERVSVWNSVPALMLMQVEHLEACGERLPDSLRLVLLSGDWLPVGLPDRIRALGHDVQVVSLGGATEASIWSICYPVGRVDPAWPSIPYGRPMANQTWHVLDAQLEPRPLWVPGDLYIGGVGLARGYLHDAERSAQSFMRHPRSGERLYRTGDWGRSLPDGEIEFLGREDFQVKVQGYRIELGEIEAALLRHESVRAAVASAVGEVHGAKRLLAWVVWSQAGPVPSEELARFLREILPEYMVPVAFIALHALPLSANGKLDRSALPLPDGPPAAGMAYVAPRDALELGLCRLFEDVLERTGVGVQASFFELGGDSLLAVRLMTRIERRFGRRLALGVLFEAPRIQDLATRLRQAGTAEAGSTLVTLQLGGPRPPLFWVHPVGGNVFCYAALARELGDRQPFHALQSPGLTGVVPLPERLEDLAALYVTEVRRVQPSGSYFLGGWSFGGVVAFEMARQLSAAGHAVAHVTIVDAWAPAPSRGLPEDDEASSLLAFAIDLGIPPESHTLMPRDLLALTPRERLAYLLERAQSAGALRGADEHTHVQRLFEVFTHHNRQLAGYRGGPYAGRVTLLRAAAAPGSELHAQPPAGDARLGWEAQATGDLDVHMLPGNHYTLLAAAHVGALARCLEARLAAARQAEPAPQEERA